MEEKLKKFITDQRDALKLLYNRRLLMPFLMVFYTTIDILGYISDKNDEKEINKRFQTFVGKYMSAKLLGIDPVDLWSARCSILHKCSPISNLSKKGKAKEFLYSWKLVEQDLTQEIIKQPDETHKYIAVSLEDLYNSLLYGRDMFIKELKKDRALYKLCEDRVLNELYCETPIT